MNLQHTPMSADNPASSASNDQSEQKPDEPSLLADLATLIAEIENASTGSPALDARIQIGYRVAARKAPDVAALLIEQGITWPTVEAVLDDQVPPFTTSLDAALDGEDITFVIRSTKRRRWGAMQKARSGEEVLAWAATEPLARRLAALRAHHLDLVASERAAKSHTPDKLDLPPPSAVADGEKDWEVLF